jgi:hypothetical protein
MAKVCNVGIKNVVKDMTKDKPWFRYVEDSNFIQVVPSPKGKINERNVKGVTITTANYLNKAINKDLPLGKVFKPITQFDGRVGVLIDPTSKQLELLNAKEDAEREELIKEVEQEERERDEARLRDEIETEKERLGYTEEQRGEFFQLDKKKLPPAQEKLDNQLLKFLSQFGVTTEEMDDFKKRFGVDALGATDVMQKLIYLSSRRNITTMPEEAAHMMVMLMGKNSPLIKEAFTNIESWSGYNAVKKQYMPIYKDENKVKVEALGHLIRDAIVNKYTSENPVEKSLFEKIKDLIENFFKGIRNKFGVKKNDDIIYDKQAVMKIAEGMLSGDVSLVTSQRAFKYSTNVDYYKALEKDPLSKEIVGEYTEKLPFKLTGSLAISKQTNIERWHGEQIHDLDFRVPQEWLAKNSEEGFDKLMDKPNIIKLREIRSEYSTYHTKSYLQAPKGYRIEAKGDRINSSAPMMDINVYDEKGNKLSVLDSLEKVKTLDFFIGGQNEAISFENVVSWQDIFQGKLSLSPLGEKEIMFDRPKDQTDYINVAPVSLQESRSANLYFQTSPETKEGTETSKASPQTLAIVKRFLKQIGVSTENVKEIVVNGVRMDANAVALVTQKLVQVLEGKEATSLPEEAMHFAVEIIQQTNPKLFNQLLKEINDYRLLKDVFTEYSENELYQTKDGKPDVIKIKKEAIAKVLAEKIINKSEGLSEKPENLAKAESMWSRIVDFLKNLFFVKSGFDQAAMKILSGEEIGTVEDIRSQEGQAYLQMSSQDRVYDKLKATSQTIEKTKDGYVINGKKVLRRVSDLVKDWYERRFAAKELTKSEYQTAVDDLKAEKGTAGHADLEEAFKLFVDKDGYLRPEPLDDSTYVSQIDPNNRDMYEALRDNLKNRLNSFPKGTRFLSEIMVYDAKRDLGGTIDFIAIEPDGKTNILDWKFMDLNIDKYQDVPWYKVNAWRTQMNQYKLMLQNAYGVKPEDFNQTRMIPIKALYTLGNAKTGVLPRLSGIQIGDVNVKNIKEDYLIPVGLEGEKTGNRKIDSLIEKLNAIYKRISEKKALPSEKLNKAEQLNSLFTAIRQLQMKQNIKPLIYQSKVLNKQIQEIIEQYKDKFQGKDPKSFSEDEISDFAEAIETSKEALETYIDLDTQLDFLFENRELSEEDKELERELRKATNEARRYDKQLKELDKEFTNDIIGGSENVKDLSMGEKVVKGLSKWFGTTATIQLKALQVLYKKANKAFTYAGMDTLNETKRLMGIKASYDNWAKSKGLSAKEYFKILMKEGKNELIDEFNPEFYSELRKKIQDKDFQWVRDNIDIPQYNAYLKEKLAEEIQRIQDKPRIGTDEEITSQINKEVALAKRMYDTSTTESLGWLQYDLIKKFPIRAKWESNEWKELNSPQNKPAKDFYDYIKERNEYYNEIGYINAKQARTFLPWVRKGLAEKLIFGGKLALGEQFLRNISLDESDVGFGKIDPLTGRPVNSIPTPFTKDLGEDYSTDLFKTMALYNEYAIKFKYLSDIEAQGRALIRLERNKKAIATSRFGKTQYDKNTGELTYTPENNENTELIEKMMNAIIYQQKFIESESFDQVLGKFGKFGENINKKLGFKLLPENLSERQISVNKVIDNLNRTFQLNALGLNLFSSMSNLFGGKTQSLINSGKYFTKSDFVSTEMWLLGNKMNGENKKKNIAALEYFLPLTENYGREVAKKLAINKLNGENIQDFLMVLMRNSDKAVQTTNFFAYLRNSIVQDGEVINAREYLRSTPEYADMYAGTAEQRKARADKFEEDVKKLIEEKGVIKLGTVNEKGEFEIPGVERKSDSVVNVRRTVQSITSSALGSLTEDNKRLINMNIYGNSFMIFKNWIPRLMDVRFGNIKYNAASDAYEWGRTRTVFRIISEDFFKSIGNLKNTLVANDKGIEFLRELYEKKRDDYQRDTGKELEMTESEFIDLVRQNVKNQAMDVVFYATLLAILLSLHAMKPDDDDDPIVRNQYSFMMRMTDKFADEIGYFYDPTSLLKTLGGGLFPSIGLLDNYKKFAWNFLKEMYGIGVGDEELVEKSYPIKYLLRSFPIVSQGASYLPMFSPNLAKDLGIRMQSRSGIR